MMYILYVFLLITGKEKNVRLGPTSRSFNKIDFSVVHLYLFGTEHAMIL